MEERSIYTGVFLVQPEIDVHGRPTFAISKFHVTYHYNPDDCMFPESVQENDWTRIIHQGIYDDGEILASEVRLEAIISNSNMFSGINFQHPSVNGNGLSEHLPLHITWNSGEHPPVEAGRRLQDTDMRNRFFTSYDTMKSNTKMWNYNEHVMDANDLNYDSAKDRDMYDERIEPLFSYFHPIGVWKTFKIPIED